MRVGMVWVLGGVIGCHHPAARPDASADDAAADAAIDAVEADAMIDASIDAPIDAAMSTSPACGHAPRVLFDVAPSRIGNIARSGDTLYTSGYDLDTSNQPTNVRVFAIDLVTRQQIGTAIPMVGATDLWEVDGDVFAADVGGGTIWRLHPGAAPVAVVTGRVRPGVVASDGTYLYWSEAQPNVIQRRLLSGGAVQQVMACDGARNLFIDGNDLYCAPFAQNMWRGPKDGSAMPVAIASSTYEFVSTIRDGNTLYFVDLSPNPGLFKVPMPDGPEQPIKTLTGPARYTGLAATGDFFYTTGSTLRRLDRVTSTSTVIYNNPFTEFDPLLWNDELVFVEQDSQVKYCVD
jgi:hypothetical protein